MTTAQKKKYLFDKLLPIVQPFGFSLYKGRLWCWRTDVEMLYYIDCTTTQWGTLNEVEVGFGTYCSPVQEGFLRNSLSMGNLIRLCQYIRIRTGFSVYALYGETADDIFMEQVEKLLPYLQTELSRIFAAEYRSDLLGHMQLLVDMQKEMQEIVSFDFAFYQYMADNLESARAFLQQRLDRLAQLVDEIDSIRTRLTEEHYREMVEIHQQRLVETQAYARRMEQQDPRLLVEIAQRIAASKVVCDGFFRRFKGCPRCQNPALSLYVR